MLSGYQKLKRQIAYHEQRERELEYMLREVMRRTAWQGDPPTVQIEAHGFLTDINTGYFT